MIRQRLGCIPALVTAVLVLGSCSSAPGVHSVGSPSSLAVPRSLAPKGSNSSGPISSPIGSSQATDDDAADICGSWDAADGSTGSIVAARFGDQRYCFQVDNGQYWAIITMGVGPNGVGSAVGVDRCASTDARCRDGRQDHAFSDFRWLAVPGGGENSLEGTGKPTQFLILGAHGVYLFDPTIQPLQLQPASLHS